MLKMIPEDVERRAIQNEIDALCIMHEKITQSSECRDFNRRVALLLEWLEGAHWSSVKR